MSGSENLSSEVSFNKVNSTEEFGRLISLCRQSQQINQRDLAEIIGRSHVYIRDVETGKPTANWGGVLQMLDELGIEIYLQLPDDVDS